MVVFFEFFVANVLAFTHFLNDYCFLDDSIGLLFVLDVEILLFFAALVLVTFTVGFDLFL